MKNLGFYNGKYDEIENMVIPFDDRVHYYGDGVYDATCAGNHIIFNLGEHVDRFYSSADLVHIEIPYTKEELKELLIQMVSKVDGDELFVYWQVTRAVAPRKHEFPKAKANLWIMIRPSKIGDMSKTLKLITVLDTRFYHCNIKTLNLLPNVLAAEKAAENGCDEVVFHRNGRVTECAHSNISILKNGILITAPCDEFILPGIARKHMIQMCAKLNIPVEERAYDLNELFDADEIIVSSSSNFCMRVSELDKRSVGGKDEAHLMALQKLLLEEYQTALQQGNES